MFFFHNFSLPLFAPIFIYILFISTCIAESEREGTRAETRIGFSAKRTSPFKSAGGSVQSTTGSRGVEKTSGYPLHSPLSPSLPLPCVTVCRLIPIQLYHSVNIYSNWLQEQYCNLSLYTLYIRPGPFVT